MTTPNSTYCSTCGAQAQGAFCGKCGASIASRQPVAAVQAPPSGYVGQTAYATSSVMGASPDDQPPSTWNLLFWFRRCIRKYAVFGGRARRREYILFGVGSGVVLMIAYVLGYLIGKSSAASAVEGLAVIVLLIPSIAVTVRRLHDLGRSGWWYIGLLIPLVNAVLGIYLIFWNGRPVANKWGPDPKG